MINKEFESLLIEYCSPTLASLKTASLFNYFCESDDELFLILKLWNSKLNKKGITLIMLNKLNNMALLYLYRPDKLQEDLQKPGVKEFLRDYNYSNITNWHCIFELKKRFLRNEDFPHEIGIFLGYPLNDVKGFVENSGLNSKLNGCWKVYYNERNAIKIFDKFRKCKEVYKRLFDSGNKSIIQLTVSNI